MARNASREGSDLGTVNAESADFSACDAVVVGSGLTGSWVAKQLTQSGLRVVLLEAGPYLKPDDAVVPAQWTVEQRTAAARRQKIQSTHFAYWYNHPSLFVDDVEHPYASGAAPYAWIRGRQVGGRSLTWGGVAMRFSDVEFKGHEDLPEGCWPLRHADLAPYYAVVERFLGVEGSRDALTQLPDGELAAPSHPMTESELRFKEITERRWADRKVICSRVIPDPRAMGAIDPKAWTSRTALRALLPAALATGRLTIRPNCIVSHLSMSTDGGRVRALACVDRVTGRRFEVPARLVVLCASTIETLRIMLNSRHRRHPGGVGNSSGLLGKRLIDKAAVALSGAIPDSHALAPRPFGHGHGILIPRFRNLSGPTRFRGGYGIAGWSQRGRNNAAGEVTWSLTAQMEVLPRRENVVELEPGLVDAWGINSVRINFAPGDNEAEMAADAESVLREMADAAGYRIESREASSPGIYVHEVGGAPIGRDRKTSVLTQHNRCWDVDNLFVADGACFVTGGWQNPSLTMMALAVRAAQHAAEQSKAGAFA